MPAREDSLVEHHLRLERLLEEVMRAARAAQWHDYRSHFETLRAELLAHIEYEEDTLYPELLARAASAAAVQALQAEHARIRRHLETLGAAAPRHDPEGCLAELADLAALMRQHQAAENAADARYASRRAEGLQAPARVVLDLRGLQPPEPIVRIFEALDRAAGEPVRAILPHEPVPLYALLRERGYSYSGMQRADGGYELLIERS
jgi:uncharacterized protein (DUF2249 family)